jgi:hypothetical protein
MKDLAPYQESLEMKELGFDEPCFGYYWEKLFYLKTTHCHPTTMPNSPESCSAPTFSQAFRFFREKYNLHHFIQFDGKEYLTYTYNYYITTKYKFQTYEEAELACLKKLIKIVK